MNDEKAILTSNICAAFPVIRMPRVYELLAHDRKCPFCEYLMDYFSELKEDIDLEDLILTVHTELGHLSPKGIQWILPYFLRYSIALESEYDRSATEFLIFHMGPHKESLDQRSISYSWLNEHQILCLIEFLQYFQKQGDWVDSFVQDIQRAIFFIRNRSN